MKELTLAQKLKIFRKQNDMNQTEFAEMLHVSLRAVQKWEAGKDPGKRSMVDLRRIGVLEVEG
jgi:DNA-binding transcriptional regulator YiaG